MEEGRLGVKSQKETSGDYDAVLLFGTTGAGKSTLIGALTGTNMVVAEDPDQTLAGAGGVVVKPAGDSPPGVQIGHTAISCTTLPSAVVDQNKRLCYWDCPGFTDTRGGYQDLVNTYTINEILDAPCTAKFLLLINQAEVTEVARGYGALGLFKTCMALLPEGTQLQEAMVIVVRVLCQDAPQNELNLAKVKLQEMFRRDEQSEALLRLFQAVDQRGHIFWVPRAKKEQIGQPYAIEQLSEIQAALQAVRVVNPTHKIAFQGSSRECLLAMLNECRPDNDAKLLAVEMKKVFNCPDHFGDDYEVKINGWGTYVAGLLDQLQESIAPDAACTMLDTSLPDQSLVPHVKKVTKAWQVRRFLVELAKSTGEKWTENLNDGQVVATLRDSLEALRADVNHVLRYVEKGAEMEAKLKQHEDERRDLAAKVEEMEKKIADRQAVQTTHAEEKEALQKQLEDMRKEQEEYKRRLEENARKADKEIISLSSLDELAPVDGIDLDLDMESICYEEEDEVIEVCGLLVPVTGTKKVVTRRQHFVQPVFFINAWPDFFRSRFSQLRSVPSMHTITPEDSVSQVIPVQSACGPTSTCILTIF